MDRLVCRDFIIVPPHGKRFDNPALLMRIQEELSLEFSAYTFVVTIEGPLRYEDFFLIPMLGVTTNDGRMLMKAYPDTDTSRDIMMFLRRYIGPNPMLH